MLIQGNEMSLHKSVLITCVSNLMRTTRF